MTSRKLLSVLVSLLATALAAGCDDPSDAEEPTPSFEVDEVGHGPRAEDVR